MVASIANTIIGNNAANKSAKLINGAAQDAANNTMDAFNASQSAIAPYTSTGTAANARLSDLMGLSGNAGAAGYGSLSQPFTLAQFQADPGYQFNLEQGQQALDRTAAAKGGVMSGAAQKAAARYSQDYASNEFNNAYNRYNTNQNNLYNRLSGLSTTGLSAQENLNSLRAGATNTANDYRTSGAQSLANAKIQQANNWQSGIGGFANGVGQLAQIAAMA